MQCYDETYFTYLYGLVIPLLLFWVILIPGALFLVMKYYVIRKKLMFQTFVIQKYGFLYREYYETTFFWEFIKMFKRIFIILIINFYS